MESAYCFRLQGCSMGTPLSPFSQIKVCYSDLCFILGYTIRGWWNGVHIHSELLGKLVSSYKSTKFRARKLELHIGSPDSFWRSLHFIWQHWPDYGTILGQNSKWPDPRARSDGVIFQVTWNTKLVTYIDIICLQTNKVKVILLTKITSYLLFYCVSSSKANIDWSIW